MGIVQSKKEMQIRNEGFHTVQPQRIHQNWLVIFIGKYPYVVTCTLV